MILKINVFTGIDRRFHSWQTSLRDIIFYCYSPILFTPEFQDCCIIHSANDDKCFGFEETLTFDVCVLASFSRSTIVAVCSHVEDLLHLLIYCFHFLADSLVNISDPWIRVNIRLPKSRTWSFNVPWTWRKKKLFKGLFKKFFLFIL